MLDEALAWREILNARRYAPTPAFIPGIILGGISPPRKTTYSATNGCQIVCSKFSSAGTTDYKYITRLCGESASVTSILHATHAVNNSSTTIGVHFRVPTLSVTKKFQDFSRTFQDPGSISRTLT